MLKKSSCVLYVFFKILFATIFIVLGLEITTRIIHFGKSPILPYTIINGIPSLPPNGNFVVSLKSKNTKYVTDNFGARIVSKNLSKLNPQDGIIVFGDSQVLGYNLNFDETFAHHIGMAINGNADNVRILASPAMDLEVLLLAITKYSKALKYKQKLAIIAINMGNDLDEMYFGGQWYRGTSDSLLKSWLTKNSYVYMDFLLIRERYLLGRYTIPGVNRLLYATSSDERVILARYIEKLIKTMINELSMIKEIIILVIPSDIQVNPDELKKYEKYYNTGEQFERWYKKREGLANMMNVVEDYLSKLLINDKIKVINLRQVLGSNSVPVNRLFDRESHHLTAVSHNIIADTVLTMNESSLSNTFSSVLDK